MRHYEAINTHFDGTINQLHSAAYIFATEVDNDVFTYKQMLHQEDALSVEIFHREGV